MLPIWKTVGFLLYVILYYYVVNGFDKWPEQTTQHVVFKLLPLMHLAFVIISTSMEDEEKLKSSGYRNKILLGLLASAVGSAFLVFDGFLICSIIAYVIVHVLYMSAFGFRPSGNGPMAASFIIITGALYFFVVHDMPYSTLKIASAVYLCFIMVMVWRATVQFHHNVSIENMCAFCGAILFAISDTLLAFDKFHGSFQHAPFWIMLTYYFGQLGITLSASNTLEPDFDVAKKHI